MDLSDWLSLGRRGHLRDCLGLKSQLAGSNEDPHWTSGRSLKTISSTMNDSVFWSGDEILHPLNYSLNHRARNLQLNRRAAAWRPVETTFNQKAVLVQLAGMNCLACRDWDTLGSLRGCQLLDEIKSYHYFLCWWWPTFNWAHLHKQNSLWSSARPKQDTQWFFRSWVDYLQQLWMSRSSKQNHCHRGTCTLWLSVRSAPELVVCSDL